MADNLFLLHIFSVVGRDVNKNGSNEYIIGVLNPLDLII